MSANKESKKKEDPKKKEEPKKEKKEDKKKEEPKKKEDLKKDKTNKNKKAKVVPRRIAASSGMVSSLKTPMSNSHAGHIDKNATNPRKKKKSKMGRPGGGNLDMSTGFVKMQTAVPHKVLVASTCTSKNTSAERTSQCGSEFQPSNEHIDFVPRYPLESPHSHASQPKTAATPPQLSRDMKKEAVKMNKSKENATQDNDASVDHDENDKVDATTKLNKSKLREKRRKMFRDDTPSTELTVFEKISAPIRPVGEPQILAKQQAAARFKKMHDQINEAAKHEKEKKADCTQASEMPESSCRTVREIKQDESARTVREIGAKSPPKLVCQEKPKQRVPLDPAEKSMDVEMDAPLPSPAVEKVKEKEKVLAKVSTKEGGCEKTIVEKKQSGHIDKSTTLPPTVHHNDKSAYGMPPTSTVQNHNEKSAYSAQTPSMSSNKSMYGTPTLPAVSAVICQVEKDKKNPPSVVVSTSKQRNPAPVVKAPQKDKKKSSTERTLPSPANAHGNAEKVNKSIQKKSQIVKPVPKQEAVIKQKQKLPISNQKIEKTTTEKPKIAAAAPVEREDQNQTQQTQNENAGEQYEAEHTCEVEPESTDVPADEPFLPAIAAVVVALSNQKDEPIDAGCATAYQVLKPADDDNTKTAIKNIPVDENCQTAMKPVVEAADENCQTAMKPVKEDPVDQNCQTAMKPVSINSAPDDQNCQTAMKPVKEGPADENCQTAMKPVTADGGLVPVNFASVMTAAPGKPPLSVMTAAPGKPPASVMTAAPGKPPTSVMTAVPGKPTSSKPKQEGSGASA